MANRIFVCAVLMLWLGSMSWLVVDKVVPSFMDGEPPMAAGFEQSIPVAWKVFWSGRAVGHAATIRTQGAGNTTNLDSRIVLNDVPLLDLVPPLMRQVVGDIGRMTLNARTHLEFDSLDNFTRFRGVVSINDIDPLLDLNGEVNGSYLELSVRFNNVEYKPHVFIADQTALSATLFPDAKLPYMYVGRRWHEEVYSPFRSPNEPVETLEAEVTGVETLRREDVNERVLKVEFRSQAGPGVPEEARLQAVAWVRADDGLVLRQDVYMSGSQLRFERLSEEEAAEVGRQLLLDHRRFAGRGRGRGMRWPRPRDPQFQDLRRDDPEFQPRERLERGEAQPAVWAGGDRPAVVD
jgi:hypothetical protein